MKINIFYILSKSLLLLLMLFSILISFSLIISNNQNLLINILIIILSLTSFYIILNLKKNRRIIRLFFIIILIPISSYLSLNLLSSIDYKNIVKDVNANTPARFNADERRLYDASGCAGKIAVFAVRLDTFEKEKNEITFYLTSSNIYYSPTHSFI